MTEHKHPWHFATQAVHAGEQAPRPDFTPIATPIYPAATFFYDDVADTYAAIAGERPGYSYTRYGNPTVAAFEEAVATLEGGEAAVAYASGMAAVLGALLGSGLRAGEAIVAAQDVYGATYSLLANFFPRFGVRTTFVDISDLAAVEAAVAQERPRALYCETMSNPLLKLADLDALVAIAHAHDALLLVDNTFTTPCLVQPLAHGADLVIHSATKYLGGHGDVTGGVVVTSAARVTAMRLEQRNVGGILGPQEAWLALRGLKTLPLRMARHGQNAWEVAEWLVTHPQVAKVYYPGLPTHPQHALARRLFAHGNCGGMVAFDIAGGDKAAVLHFLNALRLCLPVASLGDVYTLLMYPAMTSHRTLTPEQRAAVGIGDGLVRLSVGIEDVSDIIADLEQALAA
jgi:cystathionine beta-lyase/cystathionine gamma-synthase